MHQGQMTQQEKLTIQELLMAEDLCSKKIQSYMNQVQDPSVQSVLQQMYEKSQNHVNTLSSMLHQVQGDARGYNTMQ